MLQSLLHQPRPRIGSDLHIKSGVGHEDQTFPRFDQVPFVVVDRYRLVFAAPDALAAVDTKIGKNSDETVDDAKSLRRAGFDTVGASAAP